MFFFFSLLLDVPKHSIKIVITISLHDESGLGMVEERNSQDRTCVKKYSQKKSTAKFVTTQCGATYFLTEYNT